MVIKRHIFSLLLCVLYLSGCAAQAPQYGGVEVPNLPSEHANSMASDTVQKLAGIYYPAKTSLKLTHPTNDDFGLALIDNLRSAGYSVEEYNSSAGPGGGTELTYLLDQFRVENIDFYRVSVKAANASLSRAYTAQSGNLAAAGPWMHLKE